MLYSNTYVKSEVRAFEFGEISQISLGESGRGRRLLALTCPAETEVSKGMNPELTIGLTKSGRPRIVSRKDEELYMLLSSQGGYTRRGNGRVYALVGHEQDFEVLARGNGADGAAGRIGNWDVLLLRVKAAQGVIRVRTSGAGYGTPSDFFVFDNGKVFHVVTDNVEEAYDALGIDMPFAVADGQLESDEWVAL